MTNQNHTVYRSRILIILFVISLIILNGCTSDRLEYHVSFSNNHEDSIQLSSVKIYLETSVSMKGYVNPNIPGPYTLIQNLPFIISDIDSKFKPSVLYTISDVPSEYRNSKQKFNENLGTGNIFNGNSSKLQGIVNTIIDSTGQNSLNILITDCLLDLGKGQTTSAQMPYIQSQIYDHIVSKNISVAVFQFYSDFDGTHYYDCKNTKPSPHSGRVMNNRPFYIWLFGQKQAIKEVMKLGIIKEYKNANFYNIDYNDITYELLPQPRKGHLTINDQNSSFTCSSISTTKPCMITLGLDLSDMPKSYQDITYLKNNLSISKNSINCQINIFDLSSIKTQKGYDEISRIIDDKELTHFITLEFNNLREDDSHFSLLLKKEKPGWIDLAHLENDSSLTLQQLEGKTFSLKYLLGAFERKYPNDELFQIDFILQDN